MVDTPKTKGETDQQSRFNCCERAIESVFYADVKDFGLRQDVQIYSYRLCLLYTPVDFQQTNYNII